MTRSLGDTLEPRRSAAAAPRTVRVVVVDDSAVMRRVVSDALGRDPAVEVVGTAADGRGALGIIVELLPDVVTMDVEMPGLDGIAAVRALRAAGLRVPVIMLSTLTERGAAATLAALTAGASDYVAKPTGSGSLAASMRQLAADLLPRIHALVGLTALPAPGRSPAVPWAQRPAGCPVPARRPGGPLVMPALTGGQRAVVVGCSTGGPEALAQLLRGLTVPLPVPLLVVQHMPAVFTRQLAERLDRSGPTTVREAAGGETLQPGHAYLAPGDRHLLVTVVDDVPRTELSDAPPVHHYRPSVDLLFRSAAAAYGPGLSAVVLTGMGTDGRDGAAAVAAAGGAVYAQDAATSVVWGMPGAVVAAGLTRAVLPVPEIGQALARAVAVP